MNAAVFSYNKLYRYWLERLIQEAGLTFTFFGVNGSTAGIEEEDQTSLKWRGFTARNGGRRYIAVNPFGLTSTDVRKLAEAADPVGPENDYYIGEAIKQADVLVPCWGSRLKLPERLRPHLDSLAARIFASGKPVRVFGLTKSGDPKHPLMLGYETQLVAWDWLEG